MSDKLKLLAQSEKDLMVISGLLQDATVRVGDLAWQPSGHRMAFVANRFRWEKKKRLFNPRGRRVRTGFHLSGILEAKLHDIDVKAADEVLSLLDIEVVEAGEHYYIVLNFAGGAAIRLTAECIDAVLYDMGEDWEALTRPDHDRVHDH